MTIEKYKYQSL